MTVIHGFELIREQEIPEINNRARIFRHVRTGAELISMENDDTNKVFGITFATPPADSTGLPHILEHSVLCGSRKYPAKDPFIQLAKGSLNTFLNAMTFSDKTMYPVASQNLQDFYNLVDVYLDAVFFPRLSPEVLAQEGWRYELMDTDAALEYQGVVFNEMKGAYSSPDNMLARFSESSVLPDTIYGFDSGGDPRVIPDLTYEQFKTFHQTYYHPSNAKIWFYGDDDPDERLRLIDAVISEFDYQRVDVEISKQPRWDEVRILEQGFAVPDDEEDAKGMMTVNWLLPDHDDVETDFGLEILEHILLGSIASPLRKALIDSGLGEDVIGGGIDNHVCQPYFSTGMRGINVADTDKIVALIDETLHQLATDGIDPAMVEASLNTTEFVLREFNTGGYPRGLAMLMSVSTQWMYGRDPLSALAFDAPLQAIKARIAQGESYFERLIADYLLENTHRSIVILKPDTQMADQLEVEELERLTAYKAGLDADALRELVTQTHERIERQQTPDSPEVLATIPVLKLEDLDRSEQPIDSEISQLYGTQLVYHDLFTNGIAYVDVGLNLRMLPQEYLPYVNLFKIALLAMGTLHEDYIRLAQRIGRKTGGIRVSTLISSVHNHDHCTAWLMLRGKGTVDQTQDMFDIMREVLLTVNLDNRERFRQILLETKSSKEASLIPAGHQVVNGRLQAQFSQSGWVVEQMSGISAVFFTRMMLEKIENDWPAVLEILEDIRLRLVNRNTMIANVTLDARNWTLVQPQLAAFLQSLPTGSGDLEIWEPDMPAINEGLTIPAQVNYVGKGASLYSTGYELDGSIHVIRNWLNTDYLWNTIRVQGGAYGGFATFDRFSGLFSFISYRDPNLLKTLENYDAADDFLRQLDISQDEVTKAIIGTIGSIDDYMLPDAKGYTGLVRYLTGSTAENRQQIREQILGTTAEDFRQFAAVLKVVQEQGHIVVLGAANALAEANAALPTPLQITKVL